VVLFSQNLGARIVVALFVAARVRRNTLLVWMQIDKQNAPSLSFFAFLVGQLFCRSLQFGPSRDLEILTSYLVRTELRIAQSKPNSDQLPQAEGGRIAN
jgi:hypothetical protein